MQKSLSFFKALIKEIQEDHIMSIANELTYKLVLAIFPFLIFLMTLLGFFNIDGHRLISQVSLSLPPQITQILSVFIEEVVLTKNMKLLSTSLLLSIFSSSSGFVAIIRGINISYGHNDCRHFLKIRLISVILVFVFASAIISSAIALIFGRRILNMLVHYFLLPDYIVKIINLAGVFGSLFILICAICIIYKLSNCVKTKFINVLPGALVAVIFWVVASKGFNVYIENFAKYSVIYGSIGSIFILLFWLNLVSLILLIGSEINALLNISDKDSIL